MTAKSTPAGEIRAAARVVVPSLDEVAADPARVSDLPLDVAATLAMKCLTALHALQLRTLPRVGDLHEQRVSAIELFPEGYSAQRTGISIPWSTKRMHRSATNNFDERTTRADLAGVIAWLRSPEVELPTAHVPALITQLAALQQELAGRLLITPEPQSRYLPLGELAARTAIGASTLRAMAKKGVLKDGVDFIRNGRRLLFRWPQVEDRLRAHRCGVRQPVAPVVVEPFVRRGRRRGT